MQDRSLGSIPTGVKSLSYLELLQGNFIKCLNHSTYIENIGFQPLLQENNFNAGIKPLTPTTSTATTYGSATLQINLYVVQYSYVE